MNNKQIRYILLVMGISFLLSLSGCGGDGQSGIQSDSDFDATVPLVPKSTILQPFEGVVSSQAESGEVVGTIIIINLAEVDIIAIMLSGNGFENFLVDAEGVVTVSSGALLDHEETLDQYNLVATAIDSTGNNVSATTVVISVVDTATPSSEVPVLDDAIGNVVVDSPAGTLVASIPISSRGDSPITEIVLSGSGYKNFMVATSGAIFVAVGATLAIDDLYILDAVAKNEAGESEPSVVTITVIAK
ncbi:MAG: hypothetical protein DRG78_09490 [Epsilonproteobacteria bacterium]|nr:MAG: hypothetical protein DRG78_09490 [Campylobacterota bacterium]